MSIKIQAPNKTITFEMDQHQNISAKILKRHSTLKELQKAKLKDLLFVSYVHTQHEELPTSKSPSKLARYFGCES